MADLNPPKSTSSPSYAQKRERDVSGTSITPSTPAQSCPTPAPSQQTQPHSAASGEKELSNAEKKKLQKAEKAAKRAREKGIEDGKQQGAAEVGQSGRVEQDRDVNRTAQKQQSQRQPEKEGQRKDKQAQLPVRQRRQSQSHAAASPSQSAAAAAKSQSQLAQPERQHQRREKQRQVGFFSHLYNQTPRRGTLEGTSKDVHPAVQMLSLQMSAYVICGSQARCVATLLALKAVSYKLPLLLQTSIPLAKRQRKRLTAPATVH